jgi:dTDP-4-dehydrorhamnose 3,5-epimerase
VSFTFERLAIPAVVLVKPTVRRDARGFFMETYKRSAFCEAGMTAEFVQDNASRSAQNTLRGLHYQLPPAAHAKLVSVVAGEILDVAVDIRRSSPTYGRWVSAVLSGENHHALFVPVGFAHGFLVRSETADVTYKISHEYAPEYDRGILWNDPALGIDWGAAEPRLSERDQRQPTLAAADNTFVYDCIRQE